MKELRTQIRTGWYGGPTKGYFPKREANCRGMIQTAHNAIDLGISRLPGLSGSIHDLQCTDNLAKELKEWRQDLEDFDNSDDEGDGEAPPRPDHVPQAAGHRDRAPLRKVRRQMRRLRFLCAALYVSEDLRRVQLRVLRGAVRDLRRSWY